MEIWKIECERPCGYAATFGVWKENIMRRCECVEALRFTRLDTEPDLSATFFPCTQGVVGFD